MTLTKREPLTNQIALGCMQFAAWLPRREMPKRHVPAARNTVDMPPGSAILVELVQPQNAGMLMLLLVLSPNRPQPCLQHPHEADGVDRPLAMVTGPGPALDDAVVPPHDGAVERSTDHG